jgi:PEP-CTERM motif
MRRVVVLALIALALPIAAWADGIDITNHFGNISVSTSGIVSTYSQMNAFNGIVAPSPHALGYVYFGTGAFSGASLKGNGTFSATGSWFDIMGNGNYGSPKGMIFSGAFVGPISWTLTSAPGSHRLTFTLTGTIKGMLYNGHEASGTTTQYFYSSNYQFGKGIGHLIGGTTHLNASPEPGTLGLLGTGLVGIAGIFRRRKSA